MKKQLLTLLAAFSMAATVSAQVTYTCTSGKNYGDREGIDKMFDGDTSTKYCNDAGSDCYALVTASEPVTVWGYEMTTADDNETYGRLVKEWSLYGTNDEAVAADPSAEGWVTLSAPGNNSFVQQKNFYTQRFFCEKATGKYKYYKVLLSGGGFIQVSEFKLLGETNLATYSWHASSTDNSKKAVDLLLNQKWEGNNIAGNWLTLKTSDGLPHAFKNYSFTTHDDGSYKDRAPKSWRIEGSYDGNSWVTIHNVIDDATIQNQNYTTFEFTPDDAPDAKFVYIRLTLNAMKGTGWTQVGEFHAVGIADVSDETYTIEDYRNDLAIPYTEKVNNMKSNLFTGLSEDDPWYKEYKALVDGLDNLLEECKASGDFGAIDTQINDINNLVFLMTRFVNGENFIALTGTDCWGDGHYSQLVDGNENTKWGGNFSGAVGDANHVQYVIFRAKESLQPYFYTLLTGGDTANQTGRNWKNWKIYGANIDKLAEAVRTNSAWTVIDTRENIGQDLLPAKNKYPAPFGLSNAPAEPYYYFMVEVTEAYNGSQIQMNELTFGSEEDFLATKNAYLTELNGYTVPDAATDEQKQSYEDAVAAVQNATPETILAAYTAAKALQKTIFADLAVEGVYQIASAQDLEFFSDLVSGEEQDAKGELTQDIDLQGFNLTLIGRSKTFKGTFDGKGYTISNLDAEDAIVDRMGLFAQTENATIKNVMLDNANVVGRFHTGALVGYAASTTIEDCGVYGSAVEGANQNTGGLVGNAVGATIKRCAVMDTKVNGHDHVGSIAGNAVSNALLQGNVSNAEVRSNEYQAGGLVGTVAAATIDGNLFLGTVTCERNGNAGGIVAMQDNADTTPVISNNMVAAAAITGTTHALINLVGRPATFSNNYTLKETVYSDGEKSHTDKDDENGMQVSEKEATCLSFYARTLGWNMADDWKFLAAGLYPVLVWMDAEAPEAQSIAVSEAGYATIVADNELDFTGTDVEAFVAQLAGEEGKAFVQLEPIAIVPAGEAVIVKAEEGVYVIPAAVEYGDATGNELLPATTDVTADGTQYILAKGDEGVGFYKATAGTTIAAGKGYLQIVGAGVKGFYGFADNDATGIESVRIAETTSQSEPVYNLAGQRLQKVQKGINIVAGKKVLK